mgnify:CR=1 FL=1
MKIELLIIILTGFFIANTYYDGKYIQLLKSWKKYYQMGMIAFAGLSLYLFIKKNPEKGHDLIQNANGLIKYMPIDKEAGDMLGPILNFTKNQANGINTNDMLPPQQKRMLNSGKTTNRSVGETKKKYVAAEQGWTCKDCNNPLTAWFEVDHKVPLHRGGSNHIDNLDALCRNCHGKRTALDNL